MLQTYLDGMSQLLTDEKRPLHRASVGDRLSTVARARTLTVLSRLDGIRKRSILQFLYESGLITRDRAIFNLRQSDFTGVNLKLAILMQADLRGANLSGAHLRRAMLIGARLSRANLRQADLSKAHLRQADLSEAKLSRTQLADAYGVTNAQLEQQADSLEGATMPNGQKYEDWLKSKGSGEDGENGGPA